MLCNKFLDKILTKYHNDWTTLEIHGTNRDIRTWQSGTPIAQACPKLMMPITAPLDPITAPPVSPKQSPWPTRVKVHRIRSVISGFKNSGIRETQSLLVIVVLPTYWRFSEKIRSWIVRNPKPAIIAFTPPPMNCEAMEMGWTALE